MSRRICASEHRLRRFVMRFGVTKRASSWILPLSIFASVALVPTVSQAARVGRITSAHPPMSSAPRVARNVEQTQNFVYFGGHVISHPEIVVVFWGATGVPATATQNMETCYKQIVASPFMDWMGEYDTAGKTPAAGGTSSNQHINRGSFKS